MKGMTTEAIIAKAKRYKSLKLYGKALEVYSSAGVAADQEEIKECIIGCYGLGWFEAGDYFIGKFQFLLGGADYSKCVEAGIKYCLDNGVRPDYVIAQKRVISCDEWLRLTESALENGRSEIALISLAYANSYRCKHGGQPQKTKTKELLLKTAEAAFWDGWVECGIEACRMLNIAPKKEWLEAALMKTKEFGHKLYTEWIELLIKEGEYSE